jgi:hypothetical protein
MRTLVVSDLHLGGRLGVDILREPAWREPLLHEVARADRLVLLGDTLELRQGPVSEVMAVAEPILRALGAALRATAPVVLVPGNHDHALLAPWLDADPGPLGAERLVAPHDASPLAVRVAACLGADRTQLAYPGVWLRDDVYALHGHYADLHGAVPTFERLSVRTMARFTSRGRGAPGNAEDYERLIAPVYAWIHAAAQRAEAARPGAGSGGAARGYRVLTRRGRRTLKVHLAQRAFPVAVWTLERLGLGPLSSDISTDGLRRDALDATADAVAGLGIDAAHVIYGHSHRPGPRRRGVAHAVGHPPAQHRLVGPGADVHRRHRPGEPVLAGPRDRAARRRTPGAARPQPGARPGVKQTAWAVTPSPTTSSSTPWVCRSCWISRCAPV